ncbi:hypothetical protein [Blastococcus tunisiensis]|uniref:Uncharacterized protein n=1 Tax=Blastococcus tunisiensis TaxID=1798228 RepID=A0A1I2ITG9_9ACTN|nr:hypothetical protein [Blastococcus sp. DSM 46838]SFF45722.1 hypothetical protein SAMN05216574_11426 [Blastococcus sp. DSM 46838]
MVAVLVILLILVGLPLLAWWLGSRRAWSRVDARGRDQMQVEREWMSRHRLDHVEVAEVDRAVSRGRALTDDRLRAATVERAQMMRDAMRAWEESRPRFTAVMRWLGIVWLLLLITALVFAVAFGDWPWGLSFYLLAAAGSGMNGWFQRRNLRRAIELNGG